VSKTRNQLYLYAGAMLCVPGDKDRAFVTLPRGLAFLYYVIRPVRVIREYGMYQFFQRLKRSCTCREQGDAGDNR
jgi:hypothetical protein